ncbi:MAG: hypothetical protein KDD60_11375, partial [Bdellovibrionales bacterium]|nr:hypothetical protein [Bdellovibrionales bacterium]
LFLVLISIVPVTLIGVLATRKRLSSQRKSFRWLENLKLPSAVFGGFACVGSLILWWILSADALKVLVAFQVVGQYRDEITVLGKIQAASHDIVQNAFLSFGLGCLLGWLSIELLAVGREGDSSE